MESGLLPSQRFGKGYASRMQIAGSLSAFGIVTPEAYGYDVYTSCVSGHLIGLLIDDLLMCLDGDIQRSMPISKKIQRIDGLLDGSPYSSSLKPISGLQKGMRLSRKVNEARTLLARYV